MRKIEGKYGPFLGCSNYPGCFETVSLPQPETPQPSKPFEDMEREKMQAALEQLKAEGTA